MKPEQITTKKQNVRTIFIVPYNYYHGNQILPLKSRLYNTMLYIHIYSEIYMSIIYRPIIYRPTYKHLFLITVKTYHVLTVAYDAITLNIGLIYYNYG